MTRSEFMAFEFASTGVQPAETATSPEKRRQRIFTTLSKTHSRRPGMQASEAGLNAANHCRVAVRSDQENARGRGHAYNPASGCICTVNLSRKVVVWSLVARGISFSRHADGFPEIKRVGKFGRDFADGQGKCVPGSVSDRQEARESPTFSFVRIHRHLLVISPTGMTDMVRTACHRFLVPRVNQIKHERSVDRYGWVESRRWLPRAVPYAGDEFAIHAGVMQGHASSIARNKVAV